MVIFDFFLEPAAIELNFWNWAAVQVPWQNYLGWFILGSLFTYTGLHLNVLNTGYPRHLYHAYFSQLIYFLLILAK
jgi:putative membrane protein